MSENTEKLYKMFQIKGGKKIEKFKTFDINRAIKFHKWYVARYKEGLFLEIFEKKTSYNWKKKEKNTYFE